MSDDHSYAGPTQEPAGWRNSWKMEGIYADTADRQIAAIQLIVTRHSARILDLIRSEAALSESSEVALFAGQVMQKIKELP